MMSRGVKFSDTIFSMKTSGSNHRSRKNKKVSLILKEYLSRHIHSIRKFLDLPPQAYSVEAVHDLRVDIKKVKALFALISFCNKDFKPRKYLLHYQSLFKKAGHLRAIHVEKELLKKYNAIYPNNQYMDDLVGLQRERVRKLHNVTRSGIACKIENSETGIMSFLKKLDTETTDKYLKHTEKKLIKLISKKIFRENKLHVARKKLKEFYFNLRSIHPDIPEEQTEVLNHLLKTLGEWHDRQVAMDQLTKVINSLKFDSEATKSLTKVLHRLVKDKATLFSQAMLQCTNRPDLLLITSAIPTRGHVKE